MSELSRRLDEIKDRWADKKAGWSYADFPGELQLVRDAAAGRVGGRAEQDTARRMLCGYYQAKGEPDRAEELLRVMLEETQDSYRRAECLEALCLLHRAQGGSDGAEIWAQEYEAYAQLCFQGILEEDVLMARQALRAGGAAEQMGDHALLAAAAYLESVKETNVVDQLADETRYAQELERFRETPTRLLETPQGRYRQECLEQLEQKKLCRRCDSEMRRIYLALCWAVERDAAGMRYPRAIEGAWAWAVALARRTRQFQKAYPQDVLSISEEGSEAYMELAKRYMRALKLGNPAVARWVMARPEVFERMWDFSIPAAACIIWATHEENRDPEARRQAGEQGKKWLDTLLGTMTDASGAPSCFRKWSKKLPVQMEARMRWRRFLYTVTRQIAEGYPLFEND